MNLVQRKEEIIYSLSSIEAAARFCLEHFSGGKIFLFSGDLGAGKTTLISSIMSLLGVTDEVNSPTYVLQHIYRTNDSQIKGIKKKLNLHSKDVSIMEEKKLNPNLEGD